MFFNEKSLLHVSALGDRFVDTQNKSSNAWLTNLHLHIAVVGNNKAMSKCWKCEVLAKTLLSWGQGRIKGGRQRGQFPRAPHCKGATRDEIYLFQIKYSVEKFLWCRSDRRTQLYYIPMFCQVWRAPNNNWFLYIRSGEPNYYRGPHELCIVAGGPQNQQILS